MWHTLSQLSPFYRKTHNFHDNSSISDNFWYFPDFYRHFSLYQMFEKKLSKSYRQNAVNFLDFGNQNRNLVVKCYIFRASSYPQFSLDKSWGRIITLWLLYYKQKISGTDDFRHFRNVTFRKIFIWWCLGIGRILATSINLKRALLL